MLKKHFFLAATSAAMLIGSLTLPTAAFARQELGGLNLDRACFLQNTAYPWSRAVALDSRNAYSWRCRAYASPTRSGPVVSDSGMDLNRACREQHGAGAYAVATDPKKSSSWRCFR